MERNMKALYMLSIVAILAFLGMQVYWLYLRYAYSLKEYEEHAQSVIEKTIDDYNQLRLRYSPQVKEVKTIKTYNNLSTYMDSAGNKKRTAAVTTKVYDAYELLGVTEKRDLTTDEKLRLETMVADSIAEIEMVKASFDVSSAPSDGVAWNAMRNFEMEVQSPFSAEGLDSLLRKENIDANVTLAIADSMIWKSEITPHASVVTPRFKMVVPYSELEKKTVVIDCDMPVAMIFREMLLTLALAFVISMLLIMCLVWQIKTIVRLTRLDNMRNSFVATMIHELKRPISTLKMCVSGIENDKLMKDDKLRHELTAEMRIALDNLSAYFSKLRDIVFNNVEQIPLNVSSFNLSALVDSVLKSMPHPSAKTVTFENNVPAALEVAADRSHLTNILVNLIENSIKYSGDDVKVKIGAEALACGCCISVEDNGFGIAYADREKIFNRFYRGKASCTDIPGMGLGLAYVRLLVEAHGGKVSVESDEGVGSTFKMILPQ